MPRAWADSSTASTESHDGEELGLADGCPVGHALFERATFEELHDEERRAVVGTTRHHVVVEDLHHVGVLDAVGGVALVHEALAEVGLNAAASAWRILTAARAPLR